MKRDFNLMKVPKFYYRPDLNTLESVTDPGPLRPDQPTLPGFDNLPVTKPNKKPIHKQLEDLKNEHQNPYVKAAQQNTNGGGYIDKEQRIYESLNLPGYETPEKSNVSYKKLKEKEKGTYPFDTPQGIDHFTKTVKEESSHKLSPKENKDIDILNKEMKLSVLKGEIGGLKKFDNLDKTTYPSDPEQRRRLKNIDKLEKSLGYNSPEINVPYKKDTRTPNDKKRQNFNIQQRLKNTRGPSTWDLIKQTAKTPQEKREVRETINEQYKKDPSNLSRDEFKYVDRDLIKPVKVTEYPEVVLGSPPEVPQTTINRNDKPVELIVKELADERLVHEQRDWDRRYGKSGITSLKRPE